MVSPIPNYPNQFPKLAVSSLAKLMNSVKDWSGFGGDGILGIERAFI